MVVVTTRTEAVRLAEEERARGREVFPVLVGSGRRARWMVEIMDDTTPTSGVVLRPEPYYVPRRR
jgi:hypothetical protein